MSIGTVDTAAILELQGLHTIDLRVEPGNSTQAAIAKALNIDLAGKPGKIGKAELHGGEEAYTLCLTPLLVFAVWFAEISIF